MKFKTITLAFALLVVLNSCSRDEESYLNGEYIVSQVDYNGTLNSGQLPSPIPVSGTGEDTDGAYIFNSSNSTVNYRVRTRMELAFFGQSFNLPFVVIGSGPVDFVSETRFTINDPRFGLMTYDINDRNGDNFRATTRYETDTFGGEVDMILDVYLQKQ